MHTPLPPWPEAIPRVFRPVARLEHDPWRGLRASDRLALRHAARVRAQSEAVRCSGLTGTWSEVFFSNRSDYTAANTFTSIQGLMAGTNEQPVFPALFFDGNRAFGRSVTIEAAGVIGSTSTPTIIFSAGLQTTAGNGASLGTALGVSAAITMSSGVSNKYWYLRLDLICTTPGIGSNNTTLNCAGYVMSPGGFASPFVYPLEPTTPDTATWTATIDNSVTQYFNLYGTWSASSSSNTITVKQLKAYGWN